MSLSRRMMKLDKARPRYTWIERVGLPVASSLMMAQPIGLAVALLMLLVARAPTASSIPIGQVALLLLGLLWWAMFVEHLSQRRRWQKSVVTLLHVLGWLLALIITMSPYLFPVLKGQDILDVVLAVILVTWLWRRGIHHARLGFEYGDLATTFKVSLGFLLVLVMLVNAFFSFSSFEWLLRLLTPVWDALGMFIGWLLYGIIFLLTPLFNLLSFLFGLLSHAPASQQSQSVRPGRSPLQSPQGPHTLPPELVTIGRWVFLALLFLLVLLIVRKSVRRWSRNDEEKPIEEERETVDARSVFRERWQDWRDQHSRRSLRFLEALDPASLRARYRELLREVAAADTNLAGHPEERPNE